MFLSPSPACGPHPLALPLLFLCVFVSRLGDDLALCLKAVCWLAPRFVEPTLAPRLAGDNLGGGVRATREEDGRDGVESGDIPNPFETATAPGRGRSEERGEEGEERTVDEPLQLLLELAAGHLGAGVDGLHRSLSLMGGASRGLRSMHVRRAFASSLRAHLGTVQVDSVFRFDRPKFLAGGGGGDGGAGTRGVPSPGRLALPAMLNWASFRKYTVTMWVRLDPAEEDHGDGTGTATLFRFRNGEGVGVEATLSGGVATSAAATVAAAGKRTGREIVVTSYQRSSASAQRGFSARCRFGPQAEAVHLGGRGVGEGVRQGGWRFVVVSHGQPYVKRAGRLRVSVDGGVVLDTELQYPAGTGNTSRDPMSRRERLERLYNVRGGGGGLCVCCVCLCGDDFCWFVSVELLRACVERRGQCYAVRVFVFLRVHVCLLSFFLVVCLSLPAVGHRLFSICGAAFRATGCTYESQRSARDKYFVLVETCLFFRVLFFVCCNV